MREEEIKLEKVKKSCNANVKVARILETICLVATILCIIAAIGCYAYRNQIDAGIEQSGGTIAFDEIKIGGLFEFAFDGSKMIENGEYAVASAVECLYGAAVCAIVAIIFAIIKRIFKVILLNDTPFSEDVLAKIKKLFIVISVFILMMTGVGPGIAVALICWSIYNILDYGYTLQKQIDETL